MFLSYKRQSVLRPKIHVDLYRQQIIGKQKSRNESSLLYNNSSYSPRSQLMMLGSQINKSSDEGENLLEEMIEKVQKTKSDEDTDNEDNGMYE